MSGEISSSSSTDGSINSVAVVRPNQEEEEGGRPPAVATEGIEVLRKEGKWGGSRGGGGEGWVPQDKFVIHFGTWKSAVLQVLFLPLCYFLQFIDGVQFLHLGFNKLRQVPQFGSRARYNLRVLNLRNNELINIDGGWGE